MFKTIVIGVLATVLVAAAGVSAYNVFAVPEAQAANPASAGSPAIDQPAAQDLANHQGAGQNNLTANNQLANANGNGQNMNGNGNGKGNGYRGGNGQKNGTQNGTPDPQNGMADLVTFSGTVSSYVAPNFTLLSSDGQSIAVQLGNLSYVEQLGLVLHDGDAVTVTGFWDTSGSFAVSQITLVASGRTYTLRTETGRPAWAGGRSQ